LRQIKGQVFLYFEAGLFYTAAMNDIKPLLADWIRDARKDATYSQEALGQQLANELGDERGYTKANISGWENCKHSPNLRQLMAIAKITKRSLPAELITAVGGTPAEQQPESAPPLDVLAGSRPVRVGPEPHTIAIKRINVRLHAGVTRLEPSHDETFGEDLHIPEGVVAQLRRDPQSLRAFQVRGRSGEPMFFEDDVVVADISDTMPVSRELYAIAFDGEACIKQMLHRGGQWYLHSINPEFGPINAKSGELKIIGRVVYQPGRVVTGRL
jgi:transcriptional regulator with XRE-family HTH domain